MTLHRLRETRTVADAETRSLQMGNIAGGYDYADPSAIPPHGMHMLQRAGVIVTPHSLLQVDVVYTALSLISNSIVKMGNLRAFNWRFASSVGDWYKEFTEDQPAILTNTFGGGQLGGQAGSMMQCVGMQRTIWSMGLFGEAFWYILRNPKDLTPLAVEVLHPLFMVVTRKNGVVKYEYGSGNDKKELEPENVIYIPHKSLPTANRALTPDVYAGIAGGLAMACYEFGSSWFSQGQAPDFILTTDQKLGTQEVERIADKFMIRHAGLNNAHKPLVLDSGIKVTEAMIAPDKAQFLETLEYTRQVVGQWFGIPPSKMPNALQRQPTTGAHTRQEEAIAFQQDTLSGYTSPLEEVYSALILDDRHACFNEHMLSKPDAQFLAQEIQALRITQAAAINDVRVRKLGWAPLDDPAADDALAPLASNTAPSQTGSQSPKPPGKAPAQDTDNDQEVK